MGHFKIRSQSVQGANRNMAGRFRYISTCNYIWTKESNNCYFYRFCFFERKPHLFLSFVNAPRCFWPVPESTLQTAYRILVKKWGTPLTTFFMPQRRGLRVYITENKQHLKGTEVSKILGNNFCPTPFCHLRYTVKSPLLKAKWNLVIVLMFSPQVVLQSSVQ